MLEIYAGETALKSIQQQGFSPDLFSSFLGASGGPKWFTLLGLDKYLFGEFFKGRQQPLNLIGSSAGAFRAACFAQNNPVAAIERLAKITVKPFTLMILNRNRMKLLLKQLNYSMSYLVTAVQMRLSITKSLKPILLWLNAKGWSLQKINCCKGLAYSTVLSEIPSADLCLTVSTNATSFNMVKAIWRFMILTISPQRLWH